MVDEVLVEALKKRNSDALKSVYLGHKAAFIGFAKKYPIDEATIIDIYQDAIIALHDNAVNGKLDNLKSELKTYLFSIGKYMIYKKLKQQKIMYSVEGNTALENLKSDTDFSVNLIEELSEDQQKLQTAFKSLGDKCKAILTLFYYRGFTIEEITNDLNYSNKDVAKSQKSRCIKSLKNLIFNT
ncbi:RNA polymerase sigma factor [Psychroserpens damuponensis]|uniref:RNA polymerase sigma factor n=1 Tax=Psychroserpens damuponensis TaxID=943936 RepID=UPI00058C59F8|nr:sigma-70 family RNA polymerase sigma factor [Psychroserpens damuponensis]